MTSQSDINTIANLGRQIRNAAQPLTPSTITAAAKANLVGLCQSALTDSQALTVYGTPPPPPPPPPPPTGLAPPTGYTSSQLIFDDQFAGTTLDTTKWVTYQGANGNVWNNFGQLPLPYSAQNSVANGGNGFGVAMFAPSQLTVNNGLSITAQRNTNAQWAGTYPWMSGCINTMTKFSLPVTGWYMQAKVQMPDMSQGMWPAIWFMPDTKTSPVPELDLFEGGFKNGMTVPTNQLMHCDYFSAQGQQANLFSVGVDQTLAFHTYGCEFLPGKSITFYFDGKQVFQVSGVTITAGTYELMINMEVAGSPASGWHTVATAATPTSVMHVAEVQIYS